MGNLFGVLPHEALAQTEDELPPLPKELAGSCKESDFFSVHLENVKLGTADPGDARREFARAILDAAPKDCRPIDVAYFFRDLGRGKTQFKEEGRPYARGWPRMYNPVIIELFKATQVRPLDPDQDGDATAWCAAFVNYCIARATSKNGKIGSDEIARGTRSASSGSFRCFGQQVPSDKQPREGDIAVWALGGTVDGCKPGKGHVGFFVRSSGDPNRPFLVMGGNQSGDTLDVVETRNDGMFEKAMPTKYLAQKSPARYKELQGFRTASFL
ncbi:CHAP domain-containing protein [Roseateles sp. NT4]|uniref:CHAP domain-containing protein n=1 Tax=Roseateles sp. NT4 TaxID=3453715 RepID=UPI003F6FC029